MRCLLRYGGFYSYAGHGTSHCTGGAGLQDIKQLNQELVRDILRASFNDSELQKVTKGQLTYMSGTNDASNSCSLEVR